MQRSMSSLARFIGVIGASGTAVLRRWSSGLAFALVAGLTLTSFAGDTNGGGGAYGGLKGPDEDGGTVPSLSQPPTGFHLVGHMTPILEVVEGVRGTGSIQVRPLDPTAPAGLVMVSFEGNFVLRLDRAELSQGRVAVLFGTDATFGTGWLQLTVGARVGLPTALPAGSLLGLPLGSLFAPGRSTGLGLTAVGASGAVLESYAFADAETVTITVQRSGAPATLTR